MALRIRLGVLVLVVAGFPCAVAAQSAGRQGSRPAAPTQNMSPMQVHQLFDAMLVMQAQEALALSEPQYAQFVSRLKALQDTRRHNQQQRIKLIADLQRLTNPRNPKPAGEPELRRRLDALQQLESRQASELRRAYSDIDEVLTPLQQARFRVLEEQIERRKLELIGRARQNQRTPSKRPPGR